MGLGLADAAERGARRLAPPHGGVKLTPKWLAPGGPLGRDGGRQAGNDMRAMMTTLAAAAALILTLGGAPADAQGGLRVTLPRLDDLSRQDAEALIAELARVNVITSNCPDWQISDGEWALLTGTGDKLAAQLGLDPAAYDRTYYGPAFALLDDPNACAEIGPRARPLIDRLVAMGGGTEPLQ